ncbi:MAG: uracil-DNA glycosylase family protein [Oceanicaulis sp.]
MAEAPEPFEKVKAEARACRVCQPFFEHPCRPIIRGTSNSLIRIISQAPGATAQEKDEPFRDPSGARLRDWMGISEADFFNEDVVAITPIGFCYPGHRNGTDKPPRPECAPLWQARCDAALANLRLTLLIGAHAQRWALRERAAKTLTETVAQQSLHMAHHAALPHPSGRNNVWLARNPWFAHDVLPALRQRIRSILAARD